MKSFFFLQKVVHVFSYFPMKTNLVGSYYSNALKKWGYTGFAMSFRDSVTAKLKCNLLNNFYVCGPTSMNLKPHLVSKERKV